MKDQRELRSALTSERRIPYSSFHFSKLMQRKATLVSISHNLDRSYTQKRQTEKFQNCEIQNKHDCSICMEKVLANVFSSLFLRPSAAIAMVENTKARMARTKRCASVGGGRKRTAQRKKMFFSVEERVGGARNRV